MNIFNDLTHKIHIEGGGGLTIHLVSDLTRVDSVAFIGRKNSRFTSLFECSLVILSS